MLLFQCSRDLLLWIPDWSAVSFPAAILRALVVVGTRFSYLISQWPACGLLVMMEELRGNTVGHVFTKTPGSEKERTRL